MKLIFALFILMSGILSYNVIQSIKYSPSLAPSNSPYYRGNPQNPPPPPYDYNDNDPNTDPYYNYGYSQENPPVNKNPSSWEGDENDNYYQTHDDRNSNTKTNRSQRKSDRSNKSKRSKVKVENEMIIRYTQSVLSTILVAFSASAFLFLFSNFVVYFFSIPKVPIYVTLTIALVAFIATFIPNEIGNFSRASGVFLILLTQEQKIHIFIAKLVQYILALISKRKGFPHLGDPWKYKTPIFDDNDNDDDSNKKYKNTQVINNYSMTKILIVSSILGGMIGRIIAKPIPLFPNWIGAIVGAIFIAYTSTFADSFGDLLRFISYSTNEAFTELSYASGEVGLLDEFSVLSGRMLTVFKSLDKQFKIIPKVQAAMGYMLTQLMTMRMRQPTDEPKGTPRRKSNQNDDDIDDDYNSSNNRNRNKRNENINLPSDGYDADDRRYGR